MDEPSRVHLSAGQRLRAAWHAARLWFVFLAGLVGAVAALSLPLNPNGSTVGLEVNDVAQQDVLAPHALAYTSEVLTEQTRQEAAAAVPDVYDPPDSRVARQQAERLRSTLQYIDTVRADAYATRDDRLADLAALADLRLDSQTAQALLDLPEPRWESTKLEAVSVLEQVMRSEICQDRLEDARRSVPALVSISLPESQADLVVQVVTAYVAPNSFYNEAATQAARQEARQAVQPVTKSFAAGETIVARGEVVTAEQLEALRAYGLLRPPNPWQQVAARALLVVVLGCTFALYAFQAHPNQVRSTRMALTLSVLFVLVTFAIQLMIPGRTVMPYLFPAATLPMLLAILFGPGMGIASALAVATLSGFLAPRGLEIAVYAALSGSLGALVIGRADRLSSFFWGGLAAALAAVAVVVVFRFPDPSMDALGKATLLAAALASGGLSASLAFGLLLLLGNLLGIVTSLQLIELSRPDHSLLQLILREAPGTYQHSLQVANLAEQAARAIGANALLTRVGALYHDAGKALRPQFYIENQLPGQNIHEQLDPTTSAGVIISHVHDGLELARKYRLPPAVQAFIPEHHGKLEATYQYQAAVEAANGDTSQVDPQDFTYPGPRPRSRETAILMLADGVEAKARAESPADDAAIDRLVRWVIEDRLSRGQLDRTDLTLKDIDAIRRSFVNTLKGIYHPRLRYPPEAEPPSLPDTGPKP
ncbi:MAG: HDIG domain-containing metalloprotein [Chloroflexota bacterium]